MENTYLDEKTISERYGIPLKRLKSLRENGIGPRCLRAEKLFLYPIDETDYYFSKEQKNG